MTTKPGQGATRRVASVPGTTLTRRRRDHLLGAIRAEMDETFALVSDPERWHAATACEGWEVRDVVGNLVDTPRNTYGAGRRPGPANLAPWSGRHLPVNGMPLWREVEERARPE